MRARALKFYFRHSNSELPRYFDQMFSTTVATHSYSTRNRNVPRPQIPTHNRTANRTRFYIPSVLEAVPNLIKEKVHTHSYSGFSKYLKTFFIGQYSETCNVTNCHVCNYQP